MELNDLKATWQNEIQSLTTRLKINESALGQITFERQNDNFQKHLNLYIMGKQFALVYFAISMVLAFIVLNQWHYSLPLIFGGMAMLFSFYQHRSLTRTNYNSMSIVELQKNLHKFRIHSLKYSKFDLAIVSLWLITIGPVLIDMTFNVSIYSNFQYLMVFIGVHIAIITTLFIFPYRIYDKVETDLAASEKTLREIKEFTIDN